jgi:phytanoyl-CoA hydroxylase
MATTLVSSNEFVSAEERAGFEEKGFHLIRGALTADEVKKYRAALVGLLHTPADHPYDGRLLKASIPGADPTETNPRGIWAAFDLPLFDEVFYDFIFHPKITLTVSGLIGPDVNLYETSCVAKVPGFPGTYRDWHQDTEYSDPQSNDYNVTVITYLDDMDGDSGVTGVVPGTHKLGPVPHVLPTEEFSSNAREVEDKAQYEARGEFQTVKAGDTLVFLGRLIHKSAPNSSTEDKLSIAYNYVRKDTFDLGEINRYIGAGTPVVRGGRLYRPSV